MDSGLFNLKVIVLFKCHYFKKSHIVVYLGNTFHYFLFWSFTMSTSILKTRNSYNKEVYLTFYLAQSLHIELTGI